MKQISANIILVSILMTAIQTLTLWHIPELSLADTYWYNSTLYTPLIPLFPNSGLKNSRINPYPIFRNQTGGTIRIPTNLLYAEYPSSLTEKEITVIEKRYNLIKTAADLSTRLRIYQAENGVQALHIANTLFEQANVDFAAPVWKTKIAPRNIVDSDPLLAQQWHLHNLGQGDGKAGQDLNINEVWSISIGENILIGVIDDGLEIDHPDLWDNTFGLAHYDYVDNSPILKVGPHGTAVAGVAAEVGFNSLGGSGVAPGAGLVGLRVVNDENFVDDLHFAQALQQTMSTIAIYNNSWGPIDGPEGAFDRPSSLAKLALNNAITLGRQGLGSILIWAAGNGTATFDDNANLDGYANLRSTIAVSSTTNMGTAAYYSEPGANILVNAPSGGGTLDITTTDLSNKAGFNNGSGFLESSPADYTSTFTGTSASAPMVAGVVALMLSVNSQLNWREVQAILAATAKQNDPTHQQWQKNGAGFHINEQYGFGRVDAEAATNLAASWEETVQQDQETKQYHKIVLQEIPDSDLSGVGSTIAVTERLRIEFVEVTVNIPDHSFWGDLSIFLTSPSGSEIQLTNALAIDSIPHGSGFHDWTMGNVLLLGENSAGIWTIRVVDEQQNNTGTFYSWGLKAFGTQLPTVQDQLPALCEELIGVDGFKSSIGNLHLGVNKHGAPFSDFVQGTEHEDFGFAMTSKQNQKIALYHAVALIEPSPGQYIFYAKNETSWLNWDGDLASLPGFFPTKENSDVATLFQGRLAMGKYSLYGGVSTDKGEFFYCQEPAVIIVEKL